MASSSSGDGCGELMISDDVLVNIFSKMEDGNARDLAMVSCACHRFSNLVRNNCWKNQCMRAMPTIVPEIIVHEQWQQQQLGEPPAGWASLFRLLVACPGLRNTGALLETWDFGLDRELGTSDEFLRKRRRLTLEPSGQTSEPQTIEPEPLGSEPSASGPSTQPLAALPSEPSAQVNNHGAPHLASGRRSFSRELGNKLLASRFRTDSLYICDYPGCVHLEEVPRRKYQIFRGVFKNFKASHIWRNLRDLRAKKADAMQCTFCLSSTMWDMVTTFCLRRSLDYHDDGEPSVRAYVCENGHVSGCWTEHY